MAFQRRFPIIHVRSAVMFYLIGHGTWVSLYKILFLPYIISLTQSLSRKHLDFQKKDYKTTDT